MICRTLWPELEVTCALTTVPLEEYVWVIGDVGRVINMMVGDIQRLDLDVVTGHAEPSEIPSAVADAQARLVKAGYTSRLVASTH
jgi:hypothetical protein